jgi:ABC-type multidrug transport system fused ATPase/permease subunit
MLKYFEFLHQIFVHTNTFLSNTPMSKAVVNKGQYQPIAGVELGNLDKLEEGVVKKAEPKEQKTNLTLKELLIVLLPYFWPAEGSDGAFINRVRCLSTWLMVALSKTTSLIAPFYISKATNNIVSGRYGAAVHDLIIFSALKLSSQIFKEMQSILYIKVKQQASIQLQELAFSHLLSLSLNWHLSKKTGSVMKSMDRGIDAANSLISSLFLFLIPAILECLAVVVLFFINFKQWQLGLTVFIGVSLYACATIFITQWRKKFREQTNKHDNEFHDKATDSVINFETVKYFTGEAFEVSRFKTSVVKYQQFNSSTQLSLSLLNISQQVVLVT